MATDPNQAIDEANKIAEKVNYQICYNIWLANKIIVEIEEKAASLWKAIVKFVKALRHPVNALSDIGKGLLAEATAVAAIAAVQLKITADGIAATVATQFAVLAAKASAAVFQKIFQYLLVILSSGPDAAFSLANLPLSKAKEHARREAIFLGDARTALSSCIAIINRWTGGFDNLSYYRQMQAALDPIASAISGLSRAISELEQQKPVFDESAYQGALSALAQAIEITIPISVADEQFDITNRIQQRFRTYVAEAEVKLQAQKQKRLQDVDDRYRAESAPFYQGDNDPASVSARAESDLAYQREANTTQPFPPHTTVNAVTLGDKVSGVAANDTFGGMLGNTKIGSDVNGAFGDARNLGDAYATSVKNQFQRTKDLARVQASWAKDKEAVEIWYEGELVHVRADAMAKATREIKSMVQGVGNDIAKAFAADVKILKQQSTILLNSIKDAFIEYKQCQSFCGATYNSIALIKFIVQWWIKALVSNAGSGAANLPLNTMKGARSIIRGVEEKFMEQLSELGSGADVDGVASAAKASSQLTSGHMRLLVSNALLQGTITPALINLLNLENVLGAELDSFNEFKTRVYNIPDFNGNVGVWGTGAASGLLDVGKYSQLLGDIARMTSAVIGGVAGTQSARNKAMAAIANVNNDMSDISNHNARVMSVLLSWSPPQNADSQELQRTIEAAGDTIATLLLSLSFAEMLYNLGAGLLTFNDAYKARACSTYDFDHPPNTPQTKEQLKIAVAMQNQAFSGVAQLANAALTGDSPIMYQQEQHQNAITAMALADLSRFLVKGNVDVAKLGLGQTQPGLGTVLLNEKHNQGPRT